MLNTIFTRLLVVLFVVVGLVACDTDPSETSSNTNNDSITPAAVAEPEGSVEAPEPPVVIEPDPIELVVYSGRKEKFVKPVLDAFTAETGIDVQLYSGSAAQLLAKMEIEGANTPADLFISNEVGTLQIGAERGLFTSLPAETANKVADRYRGSNNQWVGLSARLRVLVVNTDNIADDEIFSVWNLISPERNGQIAITSSANGSFIGGATMYLRDMEDEGLEDWLRGLKLNAQGQAYAKHSMVVADVADGERSVGLVNHYYILRHLDANPDAPIKMVVPDQDEVQMGVALNASGIAQVAVTDEIEAGQQLVAYLLSPAGQKMFAEVNREYPVLAGIEAPGLPALDSLKLSATPLAELGQKRAETINIIEKSGLP